MDVDALIANLEGLVLERLSDGRFVGHGQPPSWCRSLRPTPPNFSRPFVVEDVFPFLTAFLPAAERAWDGPTETRSDSGFWTETGADGEQICLEATAMRIDAARILFIQRNNRLFEEHELTLQRARELRLAHRRLSREIEGKDILIHTIVHDLAAPLHSILGALSLLSEGDVEGPGRHWIGVALQAATRQRQLIEDILNVFSAELDRSGALGSEGAPDLCAAIAEVTSELSPPARQRDVTFVVESDVSQCPIFAEKTRLVRVIGNLLDNAVKKSPAGGSVGIGVRRAGADAVVEIVDRGPGVSTDLLPKLFEKFAHGPERGAGTGLGLYFCRITVEGWGGGIGYEPRGGGGARFWIRFRRAEADSEREIARSERTPHVQADAAR